MNQSDFGQLLIFHSIVQEKSITNAAKKLGITVPSVSKALKMTPAVKSVQLNLGDFSYAA